jgi:hypothetical protein
MIGRAAALLADLHVDLQPSGWRLTPRPGMDERRAGGMLDADLDAFQEAVEGYAGPVKLAVCGPWTLAARLELPRGGPALGDPGAVRDIAAALGEGIAGQVADMRRRVPGARLLVQLDEPALPAVLLGRVPTASGFGAVAAVAETDAAEVLAALFAAAGAPCGVHCCAPSPPVALARRAGAAFVGVDAAVLRAADEDDIGEAVEAGLALMLGLVSSTDPSPGTAPDPGPADLADLADLSDRGGPGDRAPGASRSELSVARRTVEPARALWRRLGFRPERLAEVVAVTPACGLAGASPHYARAALRRCRRAGQVLLEESA